MTTHEPAQEHRPDDPQPAPARPDRDDRDYNLAEVRQAVAHEQAETPIPKGFSAPWGNSRFSGAEHSIPGCISPQQWAEYRQGNVMALPYSCRVTGHPLPHRAGYTRG